MELAGKRVLLSGATGGLGRAIAEQLAAEGATLVLSSRKEPDLEELRRSLPGGAERHEAVVADLAEEGAPEKLVRDAGDLDALVANAALPASGRLDDFSQRELARAVRVNLEAPIRMTRELAPKLLGKGEGHLVYISSLSGRAATARSSLYSATKFGLRGFAFGLREDLVPKGIGVSLVSPGFVREAGMFHDADAEASSRPGNDDAGEGREGGGSGNPPESLRDRGRSATPARPRQLGRPPPRMGGADHPAGLRAQDRGRSRRRPGRKTLGRA